jgi:hypothetical protein
MTSMIRMNWSGTHDIIVHIIWTNKSIFLGNGECLREIDLGVSRSSAAPNTATESLLSESMSLNECRGSFQKVVIFYLLIQCALQCSVLC